MAQQHNEKSRGNVENTETQIPSFNFKQSFLILSALSIIFFVGSYIVEVISSQLVTPILIVMALLMGFSISFIQFYNKEESKKSIIVVGVLMSILAFVMMYIWYYMNTII